MNKPDIFTVQDRIRRLSPEKKLAHIAALIKAEGPRTSRRAELEALAKRIRYKATRNYADYVLAQRSKA